MKRWIFIIGLFCSIKVSAQIKIPSAFTPNNDGINDSWNLKGIDQLYPNNKVIIFNRFGLSVFESEMGKYEQNEFKGFSNGKELPIGSYFYVVYTDSENENSKIHGTLTLIGISK